MVVIVIHLPMVKKLSPKILTRDSAV